MDRNYELKLQISTNIRKFMKAQGLRQLDLANKSEFHVVLFLTI